jgi:hypothetical protein
MSTGKSMERPETLYEGPMNYAPERELGVVFLFAHLAKRWRLRIDEIKPGFPDCIAFQKSHGKEKKIRIEFELKSRNFKNHRHPVRGCDWIVCWEHNWPDAPKGLTIIELRREFGLGFNVWLVSVKKEFQKRLDGYPKGEWSAPGQAHKGDLVLFYFSGLGNRSIKYVYRCEERAFFEKRAGWKKGTDSWKSKSDYRAEIRRICELRAPVFLDDLQRHRILKTAGFVRGDIRGRPNVTEYWPYLYDLIARRNPLVRRCLRKYSPESL